MKKTKFTVNLTKRTLSQLKTLAEMFDRSRGEILDVLVNEFSTRTAKNRKISIRSEAAKRAAETRKQNEKEQLSKLSEQIQRLIRVTS